MLHTSLQKSADRKYLPCSPDGYSKEVGVCTYSTPHAPRHQKGFMLGSHSALKLKKSYNYLNEGRLNNQAWSATDSSKQRKKTADREQEMSSILATQPTDSTKLNIVQPFRRTFGPTCAVPDCIPPLDLRRFNEPDEEMRPVKLVSFPHPMVMDTDRTDISWGTSRLSPTLLRPISPKVPEASPPVADSELLNGPVDCQKEDNEVTEGSAELQEPVLVPTDSQNEKNFKFVENRVVSLERGREEQCHPTQASLEDSKTKLGLLNEKALSKRIRFSARILTQNGRDIHRELCGFFFLADNSLTIYEFRQFGQRASALPFIPRKVYKHPIGRRKGETYEIRHIKKGATLYFDSYSVTSLPESLKKRPIVGIRVSDVDDDAKFSVMKSDLNPSQYAQVDSYLSQSPSEESKRHSRLLQTLQGMVRNRLVGRASHVLVGLGRYLKRQSSPEGLVDKVLLQQGMRAFHISLTPENFDQLWNLLQEEHGFDLICKTAELQEGVWLGRVVSGLTGGMNEERQSVIRKVFLKMDSNKSGYVKMVEMQKYFSPLRHPDVVAKKRTVEELMHSLFGCLQPPLGTGGKDTKDCVSYADFEHYYSGVSIETKTDIEFINTMMRCWSAV